MLFWGSGAVWRAPGGFWAVRRRENRKNSPFLSDCVRGLARKRPRFDLESPRGDLEKPRMLWSGVDASSTRRRVWHGICMPGGGERQFKVPGSKFQVTNGRQPAFGGLRRAVTLNFELETWNCRRAGNGEGRGTEQAEGLTCRLRPEALLLCDPALRSPLRRAKQRVAKRRFATKHEQACRRKAGPSASRREEEKERGMAEADLRCGFNAEGARHRRVNSDRRGRLSIGERRTATDIRR